MWHVMFAGGVMGENMGREEAENLARVLEMECDDYERPEVVEGPAPY